MLDRVLAVVDKPTGAVATSGVSLLVTYIAKASERVSELTVLLAPFAGLAGIVTTFLVCGVWIHKAWRRWATPDRMKCGECGRPACDCECP